MNFKYLNIFVVVIMLLGCSYQQDSQTAQKVYEKSENRLPTEQEIEYYAHVVAVTGMIQISIDDFYRLNEESANSSNALYSDKWWDELTKALISLGLSIDKYFDSEHSPSKRQERLHELFLEMKDPLDSVSSNFANDIINGNTDGMKIGFDQMRKVSDLLLEIKELNNEQFEAWQAVSSQ